MRLFISCPLSNELTAYLASLSAKLPHASLIIPKTYDLTIKFLGETPPEQVKTIQQLLSGITLEPFEAQLTSLGVFSEHHIRVVWVGVGPEPLFNDIQRRVDAALSPLFPPNQRFLAHITLARVKVLQNRQRFLSELKAMRVEPVTFTIDRLALMNSLLTKEGATHQCLDYTESWNGEEHSGEALGLR